MSKEAIALAQLEMDLLVAGLERNKRLREDPIFWGQEVAYALRLRTWAEPHKLVVVIEDAKLFGRVGVMHVSVS